MDRRRSGAIATRTQAVRLDDCRATHLEYAHITHTKQVAMEWRKLFLPYRYNGVLSEDARIDAAKL